MILQGSIIIIIENIFSLINKFIKLQVINHKNPINIFKSVWPDIIFANNLTDKLITLEKYEIISIITKAGIIIIGTPLGKNNLNIFHLFMNMPIIFAPPKNIIAIYNVIIKELVIVKVYGTIPIIFEQKKKKNVTNIWIYWIFN